METIIKRFARSLVHPTPTGFFVANAGEVKPVPAKLVPHLEREGYFEEKWDEVTDAFEAGDFRVLKGRDSGSYFITGEKLGQAESTPDAATTQARLDELNSPAAA